MSTPTIDEEAHLRIKERAREVAHLRGSMFDLDGEGECAPAEPAASYDTFVIGSNQTLDRRLDTVSDVVRWRKATRLIVIPRGIDPAVWQARGCRRYQPGDTWVKEAFRGSPTCEPSRDRHTNRESVPRVADAEACALGVPADPAAVAPRRADHPQPDAGLAFSRPDRLGQLAHLPPRRLGALPGRTFHQSA